jgi:hypothetical protein
VIQAAAGDWKNELPISLMLKPNWRYEISSVGYFDALLRRLSAMSGRFGCGINACFRPYVEISFILLKKTAEIKNNKC